MVSGVGYGDGEDGLDCTVDVQCLDHETHGTLETQSRSLETQLRGSPGADQRRDQRLDEDNASTAAGVPVMPQAPCILYDDVS